MNKAREDHCWEGAKIWKQSRQGWWKTPLTLILRRKRQDVFNFKATLAIQQGFFLKKTKPGGRAHSEGTGEWSASFCKFHGSREPRLIQLSS